VPDVLFLAILDMTESLSPQIGHLNHRGIRLKYCAKDIASSADLHEGTKTLRFINRALDNVSNIWLLLTSDVELGEVELRSGLMGVGLDSSFTGIVLHSGLIGVELFLGLTGVELRFCLTGVE